MRARTSRARARAVADRRWRVLPAQDRHSGRHDDFRHEPRHTGQCGHALPVARVKGDHRAEPCGYEGRTLAGPGCRAGGRGARLPGRGGQHHALRQGAPPQEGARKGGQGRGEKPPAKGPWRRSRRRADRAASRVCRRGVAAGSSACCGCREPRGAERARTCEPRAARRGEERKAREPKERRDEARSARGVLRVKELPREGAESREGREPRTSGDGRGMREERGNRPARERREGDEKRENRALRGVRGRRADAASEAPAGMRGAAKGPPCRRRTRRPVPRRMITAAATAVRVATTGTGAAAEHRRAVRSMPRGGARREAVAPEGGEAGGPRRPRRGDGGGRSTGEARQRCRNRSARNEIAYR